MQHNIFIWDIPTRLFHWLLVISIAYSWYAIEVMEDLEQHFLSGYCVLTLVLFRLIWGFVGTFYARFSNFIYPLSETWRHIKSLPMKKAQFYPGHSPAGALSVMALLLVIGIQLLTGLFSSDDYYFGPLYGLVSDATATTITEIHHLNFNIVTGLIVLHLLAIMFYRAYKKQRLVGAMISGKKSTDNSHVKPIDHSRLLLATIVFCLCAASVFWLANTSFLPADDPAQYNFY